jgi:hypothetical protein
MQQRPWRLAFKTRQDLEKEQIEIRLADYLPSKLHAQLISSLKNWAQGTARRAVCAILAAPFRPAFRHAVGCLASFRPGWSRWERAISLP